MSAATKQAIEDFLRGLLTEKLALCTEKQRALFHDKVYPKGVPAKHLEDAIDLCDRTLQTNGREAARAAIDSRAVTPCTKSEPVFYYEFNARGKLIAVVFKE